MSMLDMIMGAMGGKSSAVNQIKEAFQQANGLVSQYGQNGGLQRALEMYQKRTGKSTDTIMSEIDKYSKMPLVRSFASAKGFNPDNLAENLKSTIGGNAPLANKNFDSLNKFK